MHFFQTRNSRTTRSATPAPRRRGFFHRKDKDRVAGGLKASLVNPNTTRAGRKQAKRELRAMGHERDTHISLMNRIKRTLGMRSTPRRTRVAAY
ncbi:hypothetical protein BDN70DRAFT_214648 [Pholiota conissans]|uniref:Uncharacterized protein n=1 Tax=Pholiota conissans TaxID=109636 RepID=A0A9P5ZA86_9AGAR|nr:hypothetical protein BDN70DRAFT_214648 [Pholiota conissans]